MAESVIIEAAINGVTSKTLNPNTPKEPAEIADDALRCFAAGAAVVHNHIDSFGLEGNRAAERYLEGWRPDALFYPTTNAGADVEASYAHIAPLAESGVMRLSLCDPGSVNLGGLGPGGLPASGIVYANSFDDVAHQFGLCARYGLGPSIAIYEPGFLRCVLAWWRAGRLPAGAMVKFYFGGDEGFLSGFGFRPTPTALDAYLELLGDCPVPWAVAVLGGDVLESGIARTALERGGHVRVGLEDYAGPTQPTNEKLVQGAVAVANDIGRPVAAPDEAAKILDLT